MAVELALACGENMRRTLGAAATMKGQGDLGASIDPVTATDLENERLCTETLTARFPGHLVVGEETSSATGAQPPLDERPTWIIDPIDGTQNFAHSV